MDRVLFHSPVLEDLNMHYCFPQRRFGLRSILLLAGWIACSPLATAQTSETSKQEEKKKLARATFGGGCFWCTEAVFQRVKGVESVVSGYAGGTVENPTYEQVCTGETGHAEVIQITYDPEVVAFSKLLEIHWKTHDPTTLNRQGYDEGTQYRSVIFYEDDQQRRTAEEYKEKLNRDVYEGKIVTEISPLPKFYAAEKYHQNYFNLNSKKGYCQAVIVPKLKKFEAIFEDIKK